MRKGMATGKMEEETKELLDYYNELWNRTKRRNLK